MSVLSLHCIDISVFLWLFTEAAGVEPGQFSIDGPGGKAGDQGQL